MHDEWADLKNDKLGGWERFDVIPVSINLGLYRIVNHQGREMSCEDRNSHKLRSWRHGDDIRKKEFQFFPQNGGFLIYNPFTQRFVGPYDDGNAGCHHTEVHHAIHFFGIKRPMDEKFRLKMYPSLFRTELTAEGYGHGWGFQRSFGSKWFAFFEIDTKRWFKADKKHEVTTNQNRLPGAWEKFELNIHGPVNARFFSIRSFHGTYITCLPEGKLVANHRGPPNLWEQFIIYETKTNNIKLYSPAHGKYVKMEPNGYVHCNELHSGFATEWTTPG